MAKIRHGRYPIYDLTKTSNAYLRPSPVAAGKVALNMFRAFVDGLTDNDEKIACSKKHAQFKTRMQTLYPIGKEIDYNQYSIYDQKQLKNHTFWGCTYLYSSYLSNRPHVSMPRAAGG